MDSFLTGGKQEKEGGNLSLRGGREADAAIQGLLIILDCRVAALLAMTRMPFYPKTNVSGYVFH